MNDLQEHINKEAEEQLKRDIIKFLEDLHYDNKFFTAIKDQVTKDGETFHKFFFLKINGSAYKILLKELRPRYIEKLSKEYYKKLKQ